MTDSKNWHDKSYKWLLIIPVFVLIACLIFLLMFYQSTGDIINKDISLKGGTSITVFEKTDINQLGNYLDNNFEDYEVRSIEDLRTREQQGFIVEVAKKPETIKPKLEEYLGFELTQQNSSTEFTGSSIGLGFYRQLRTAIIIAFILMAIVVFIIFRTFIPSIAVVLAAFADIIMTLAMGDFLGLKLSAAGIVAFLMLIGYSVDSDILLTTKILRRREGNLNERILSAFKTGLTMTLTSLSAVIISLLIVMSLSETLAQLFTILAIGLSFDLFNTWISNLGILKWYAQNKGVE